MNILIWVAEHSVWISCVALFVVIPLKIEHWLPKQVKKYLLITDIFIAVSTPLLGVMKENLDEHWKYQLKKQSAIHENEIAALKRDNKNIHLSFSSATTNSEAANKELRAQMDHAEKIIAPPTISLIKKTIEKTNRGLAARLTFQSSKAEGLPPLSFKAKILEGNSRMIEFFLDMGDDIQQTNIGDGFPEISSDGKSATTKFHAINSPKASIRIEVDSPATVKITGTYLKSPVIITIP